MIPNQLPRGPHFQCSLRAVFLCSVLYVACPSSPAAPVQFGEWHEDSGVQVAPVYDARPPAAPGPLMSLSRGQDVGMVRISETGNVNMLKIENSSDEPALLLAGEIVTGGLQDRAIAHDTLIPAGTSADISVFCVEQGRWSAGENGPAEFKARGSFLDGDARVSAQVDGATGANQLAVWSYVAEALEGFGVQAPTSNYGDIANSGSYDTIAAITQRLGSSIARDNRAVGLAVAYGGQVQKIEYFSDPQTFAHYRDPLIKSYVATALKEPRSNAPLERRDLEEFAAAFVSSEARQFKLPEGTRSEISSPDFAVFELFDRQGRRIHYQKARRKTAKLSFASGPLLHGENSQRVFALRVVDDKTGAPVSSPTVATDPPRALVRCDVLKDGSGTVFLAVSVPSDGSVEVEISSAVHAAGTLRLDASHDNVQEVRLRPAVYRMVW